MILDAPHELLLEIIDLADEESRRRIAAQQGSSSGDRPPDDGPGNLATQAMKAMEAKVREQEAARGQKG